MNFLIDLLFTKKIKNKKKTLTKIGILLNIKSMQVVVYLNYSHLTIDHNLNYSIHELVDLSI